MIRVLLAEDQAMMRGALAVLLDLEDDLEVVAQVADGAEIVPTALEVVPDVALLDIELPHVSGLEAAAALAEALPACRVVMVTTFGRPGYLQRAMAAGAAGFLVKDGPVEGLAEAIRKVAGGATVVDPELAGTALRTAVEPADPARARRPGRGRGRVDRRRHRRQAAPVGEHGAQLPLGRDREDGYPQPHRGGSARASQRLALTQASYGAGQRFTTNASHRRRRAPARPAGRGRARRGAGAGRR